MVKLDYLLAWFETAPVSGAVLSKAEREGFARASPAPNELDPFFDREAEIEWLESQSRFSSETVKKDIAEQINKMKSSRVKQ
jgi:hypothetical protein